MSYTPTTWTTGDVITAEKLNKLEQGVAQGESSPLVVTLQNQGSEQVGDKTWQQVHDAFPNVVVNYNSSLYSICRIGYDGEYFFAYISNTSGGSFKELLAKSADDVLVLPPS